MTADLSAAPCIECRGLSKTFGAVRALRDVNFSLDSGRAHGLLGANGAGKSTLLKILSGVYPHSSYEGDVYLRGEQARFKAPHDALSAGLGYVPQELNVLESLTVAENIFVGRLTEGGGRVISQRRIQQRAARLLAEWNIPLDPTREVARLSVSERQLAMIARALAEEPGILVLDEPTSSLTVSETARLFEIIRALTAGRVTVLFISHRMPEVFAICQSVTILRNGTAVSQYEREDFDEDLMVQDMIGRRIASMFPERRKRGNGKEALRVENLNVRHPLVPSRHIVSDASFGVEYGEILGIAGLMGAGRTELLDAIYGRLPYDGTIYREGSPVAIDTPRAAKEAGIALLTEDRKSEGVLFNLDVGGNISVSSLGRIGRHGVISRWLERQGVDRFMERLAIKAPSQRSMMDELSGGNQQKVIFARVLMSEPRLILLDEPTKGIDVGTKQEIYGLICSLAEQGAAIIMVSSEFEELLGLCDRIIVLRDGAVVDEVDGADAAETTLVAACSGGVGLS
jgi:ABC-type sugar transport system ATPase subunit